MASFNEGVSSPSSIKLIYCIVILIFPISSACVICFIFLTSLILLLTLLDFYNSIYLHHKLFAIFWQVYIVKTYKTYTLPRYTYLHPLLSVHLCSSALFQVFDNLVQNFSGLILFPMWESYQLCTKSVFDISRKKRHRIKFGAADCRQSPHVKVWTFLVFSTRQMHLYDIHTTKALRFQCFRGRIYMKRGAL